MSQDQNEQLRNFIGEHRNTALIVIRKSGWAKKLDEHDIEEIIHICLWKCFTKFNPERASIGRFINIVVSSYLLRLVKKKMKIREKEVPLWDIPYNQPADPSEYFSDKEWSSVETLINGYGDKSESDKRKIRKKRERAVQRAGRFAN
jgi:hypothetical protein